jgi:serine/threonine protein phosphatase PrpC
MKRIQKEGGVVDEDERLNGVLAVSRAIGDHDLKHKGLSSVPHFNKKMLSAKDKFCVIASDGIWDEVSNDKAFDIAKECDNAKTYAKKLMEAAIKNGSSDNISVIVIKLQ